MVGGCYGIQGGRVEVSGVFTGRTPGDAYRGAGRPEALFLVERMVDILARKLKMDPAEIRRKNFIPADKFPFASTMGLTYDSGNYAGTLEKALQKVGYDKLRKEQADARRKGRLIGIGLSSYVELCGLGPSSIVTSTGFAGGLWGASTVRLHPTGKATVYTGGIRTVRERRRPSPRSRRRSSASRSRTSRSSTGTRSSLRTGKEPTAAGRRLSKGAPSPCPRARSGTRHARLPRISSRPARRTSNSQTASSS